MKLSNLTQTGPASMPLKALQSALFLSATLTLTACGGSSSSSDDSPSPITAETNQFYIQSDTSTTYGLNVSNPDNAALTYKITTPPKHGTATIDGSGTITYTAGDYIGADSMVVNISNGTDSISATVDITVQTDAVFDYQFYKVTNPETANDQIVRYDPNNDNPESNQDVIKENVILDSKVFVMSGTKENTQITYKRREFAVFLDPNASSETRNYDDGSGSISEYTFFTDNILKRFDARNTNNESVIYQSSMMPAFFTDQGVSVIGSNYQLHTVETDIDNSYVQLKAFNDLPDPLKSETESDKKQLPLVVRIGDSAAVTGRIISPITNEYGRVTNVLISDSAAYTGDTFDSVEKSLKVCDAALTSCNNLSNTNGSYYFLTHNDGTVYMAKAGDDSIYAYTPGTSTVAEVSGVTYPANYDPEHHQIAFNGGHGGSGIFSNFYNLGGVVNQLADGDTSYLLINYNLDTQDPIGTGAYSNYGMDPYVAKNAMILKLTGTTGTKVYDNGNGVDLMNDSDEVAISYNLSLTAVKDGNLFVEAAKFNGPEETTFNYREGWIDTNTGTNKTKLDNAIVNQDLPYFTSVRVPPVAVGDYIYVNETNPVASSERVYNIYKMPIDNTALSKDDASIEKVYGRMYFERSAYRLSGVYEGNVLLWDKNNNGTITNVTTGNIMGVATDIDEGITNVTASSTGNGTLSGIGGLFGLHMTTGHGSTPYLTSGESSNTNSLKAVNQIDGEWIID